MFPMKCDDLSHTVIQHFFSFQCWNPVCGYACSPQAGIGTQVKAQLYHSHHSYVGFSLDCWDSEPSAWHAGLGPLYFIHTTYLYFSGNNSFTDETVSLKSHSKHNQPRPTHFMSSQWLITYTSNPTCLAPPNHGKIHLFNRLHSQPIGFCTTATILHTSSIPPGGICQVLCRKDRYHFYSPVQINHLLIPIPASLFIPLSILLLIHYTCKQTSSYPGT